MVGPCWKPVSPPGSSCPGDFYAPEMQKFPLG